LSPEEATPSPAPPAEPDPDQQPAGDAEAPPTVGTGPTAGVLERSRSLIGTPTGLLLALAGVVIILYGMRYAAGILNSIFLALFVVMGITPLIHWLRRKGLAPWATLVVVLVLFVVIILLFLAVMAASLTQLDDKLPVYKENLSQVTADARAWFDDQGIDISGLVSGALSPTSLIDIAAGLIKGGINALTNIGLMIFIVLFMISETFSFPRKFTDNVKMNPRVRQSFERFSQTVRTYLFTKAWLSAIMTVIVAIIYYAFGVDFALLWALIFFVFSFIPNIGFVLAVIPPFFVALLESGFWTAFVVIILVIVFNTIVDNVISPRVMGQSVGLSSLVVFLSLILWAWVLGGVGALIAVPMTLMVKLLFLDSYESTRPISQFMETGILDEHRKRRRRRKQEKEAAAGVGASGNSD
jgi:predicted PurR-regulated permease PerM